MVTFLCIVFLIMTVVILAATPSDGTNTYQKTKSRQANPIRRDNRGILFSTALGTEGLNFHFNCHPVMMKSEFVVIDFETATKMPMSVVSLGITTFKNGEAVTREWLFKPYRTKEFEFTYLHGITPEMVKDKPFFHEAWPEIYPLLKDKVLVAHNAFFDLGLLVNLIKRRSLCDDFTINYICTLELSRKMLKKYGFSCSLENLCEIYKIPHGKHNGGKDTISTLLLLNELFFEQNRCDEYYQRILKGKKYSYG